MKESTEKETGFGKKHRSVKDETDLRAWMQ